MFPTNPFTTFLNYVKFADLLMLRLNNCERVRRVQRVFKLIYCYFTYTLLLFKTILSSDRSAFTYLRKNKPALLWPVARDQICSNMSPFGQIGFQLLHEFRADLGMPFIISLGHNKWTFHASLRSKKKPFRLSFLSEAAFSYLPTSWLQKCIFISSSFFS